MNDLFYIHWTSGKHQGWTSLPYTQPEIDRIEKRYLADDPEMTFELIPAVEQA